MSLLLKDDFIRKNIEELKSRITERSKKIFPLMKVGEYKSIAEVEAAPEEWVETNEDTIWGDKIDSHTWFKTTITIDKEDKGRTVVLSNQTGQTGWDATNPQFLVYLNGEVKQALDINHQDIYLTDSAKPGDTYDLYLLGYAGMIPGGKHIELDLRVINDNVFKLFYDMEVPYQAMMVLDKYDANRVVIQKHLVNAAKMLDFRALGITPALEKSVEAALEYMDKEFYEKECGKSFAETTTIGHTHIDVAWLWRLRQTREKAVRSFATVLDFMDRYPEYMFMSSQPQLYKFVKEDQPELYKRIQKRIREGRWEPEGAMWLEADCNLTSGESLVRQVMFGKRFFKDEFGVDSKILWLPDVFGYSAALPQVLRKSGVDYFMTTKISWNEYNRVPMDSFTWRGLDGSEVLTHFITTRTLTDPNWDKDFTTTYNGDVDPGSVLGGWKIYLQKEEFPETMISYGFGDGGGGPTLNMLETNKRMVKGIPGMPKTKNATALSYFQNLDKATSYGANLPKWVGELYFEYHRGTYTSMARNKKYNRVSEFSYENAEFLCAINKYALNNDFYPQQRINDGWETILLNQFHDILPGSSIKEVYEDSKEQYEQILADVNALNNDASANIAASIGVKDTSVVVFNQLSFMRDDVAEFDLPEGWNCVNVYDGDVKLPVQKTEEGKAIFFATDIPAKGYKTFRIEKVDGCQCSCCSKTAVDELENDFFKIKLDKEANITSIYDIANDREVLKAGQRANVIQVFEDKPMNFQAWDINIYYQNKMWEANDVQSIEMIENGEVRTVVRVKRKFVDSTIAQDIILYNQIGKIDFKTEIDWKERDLLVKASFPVDVHADKATYETQFGNLERPTHWNTSWDMAKFEVCAHKWADLSEDGYGVSLLNDCKYGHDIKDSNMRITLLKSAIDPNPDADRELHKFTYSLYPHAEDWKTAETVQYAYNLNCPLETKVIAAQAGDMPEEFSMANVSMNNVIIEVIKKAEDSDDMIIRAYECFNRRTNVEISLFKDIAKVYDCDLLENEEKELEATENSFSVEFKPYEIKTFKVKF